MSKTTNYTLGLDYGTASVRALIVRCEDGESLSEATIPYPSGDDGVILDGHQPDLARQSPSDYLSCLSLAVQQAIQDAKENDAGFSPMGIVGIGVDTTGSTPLPIDEQGNSLTEHEALKDHVGAQAWLWKDHTAAAEAQEITQRASEQEPAYLEKCGGVYSSEWFWAKLLKLAREHPEVMKKTYDWVELCDWIPAILTGCDKHPVRSKCAAGHKGLYHDAWGGFPSRAFLDSLHPSLAILRNRIAKGPVQVIDQPAGKLNAPWAERLGLRQGIPVATGALDAHMGAVGSGIKPGVMVKIMGTSTCDIVVAPLADALPYVPGLCGMASESVLPGCHGLEAGQSAVGDLFHWWTASVLGGSGHSHASLTQQAQELKPGQSGLLALDWNHGNRSLLCDPKLSGLILGQTLHTRPYEIYRALIEATAFGARMITDQLHRHGVVIESILACGGLAEKNPMLMQIYADVLNKPVSCSASEQTCALGSAIAGSVVAGVHPDIASAQQAMIRQNGTTFVPCPDSAQVYASLFELYRRLHDAFGKESTGGGDGLGRLMKELNQLRQQAVIARL